MAGDTDSKIRGSRFTLIIHSLFYCRAAFAPLGVWAAAWGKHLAANQPWPGETERNNSLGQRGPDLSTSRVVFFAQHKRTHAARWYLS